MENFSVSERVTTLLRGTFTDMGLTNIASEDRFARCVAYRDCPRNQTVGATNLFAKHVLAESMVAQKKHAPKHRVASKCVDARVKTRWQLFVQLFSSECGGSLKRVSERYKRLVPADAAKLEEAWAELSMPRDDIAADAGSIAETSPWDIGCTNYPISAAVLEKEFAKVDGSAKKMSAKWASMVERMIPEEALAPEGPMPCYQQLGVGHCRNDKTEPNCKYVCVRRFLTRLIRWKVENAEQFCPQILFFNFQVLNDGVVPPGSPSYIFAKIASVGGPPRASFWRCEAGALNVGSDIRLPLQRDCNHTLPQLAELLAASATTWAIHHLATEFMSFSVARIQAVDNITVLVNQIGKRATKNSTLRFLQGFGKKRAKRQFSREGKEPDKEPASDDDSSTSGGSDSVEEHAHEEWLLATCDTHACVPTYDDSTKQVTDWEAPFEILGNITVIESASGNSSLAVYCRHHQCRKCFSHHNVPSIDNLMVWFERGKTIPRGKAHKDAHLKLYAELFP